LFFLHPLVIEHRHSYFKMIKMIHLLSMLNKDEHDDLRKDLLYIYNYV
jgi:flagellin-specific chaperone FliS